MKTQTKHNLMDNTLLAAILKVVTKHWQYCKDWREGEPTRVFVADNYIAVQYESGKAWKYDLDNCRWIPFNA